MEPQERPNEETLNQWHSDSSNWKWGVFYYNNKDKRIFPPKRIKALGWTINFANPYSTGTFVLLLAIILAILIWCKNNAG